MFALISTSVEERAFESWYSCLLLGCSEYVRGTLAVCLAAPVTVLVFLFFVQQQVLQSAAALSVHEDGPRLYLQVTTGAIYASTVAGVYGRTGFVLIFTRTMF